MGNIAPEQSDIKLVCRGLGHGNTHALTFAPSTPQEMLDLTVVAFDRAFRYRNPVIIVGDGYMGQMTGRVALPETYTKPGLPSWAVYGDAAHRGNLMSSIDLEEVVLERRNQHLLDKYADEGIRTIENRKILKLKPFSDIGTPVEIINKVFGGKSDYENAIRELEQELFNLEQIA